MVAPLKILDGMSLYEATDKGTRNLGPLKLEEGARSERFVIIERFSGEWCNLKKTDLNETEKQKVQLLTEKLAAENQALGKVLLVLEGRFQMADLLNQNNRIYPNAVWEKIFERNSVPIGRIGRGEMLSEVDHPRDGETLLQRVGGMVTEIRRNPENLKEILGRLVVFDNVIGRNLKAIHDGGGRFGVSSRGQGSVVRLEGKDVVQDDFMVETWDVVHNPSTPDAYPRVMTEAKTNDLEIAFARAMMAGDTQKAAKIKADLEKEANLSPGLMAGVGLHPKTESVPENRHLLAVEVKSVLNRNYIDVLSEAPTESVQDMTKAARKVYREAMKLPQGAPLNEQELEGIAAFVTSLRERITYAKESTMAPSKKEEKKETVVKESKDALREGGADREKILKEATDRFQPLLEAETAGKLTAVADAARVKAQMTEMSAKLAAAKQVIEALVKRVKTAEAKARMSDGLLESSYKLIEALTEETTMEGLRSAVRAIASTHPHIKGLSEKLCEATNVVEAIRIANVAVLESLPAVDRSGDLAEAERLQQAAITATQTSERRRLAEAKVRQQEAVGSGVRSSVLETSSRLMGALKQKGGAR